ncbi:MAG: AAA family ATPase [Verrucomicrobiota bacterium]
MPTQQIKLKLPQIEKVKLCHFSLFTANPDAEFPCNTGVVCLVGANGIGKSTLLSAINFALTGTVSDPNRPFKSIEEYYKYTREYSSNYFRGRIAESDEDEAEIALSFRLGSYDYELRRSLFEPDELRGLSIRNRVTGEVVVDAEETPRGERHRLYVSKLAEHSALASFEEFVFLQHFVFTFDEQRRTLFWDAKILDRVLYRAFGFEPDMANKADHLWREIESEDSRVRNYQWEATRMRKRINEIRTQAQASTGAKETFEKLVGDHQALSEQFDEESQSLKNLDDAIKDANLRLAEHSVHETSLRDEYAQFFDRRLDLRPALPQHPFVTQSIAEHSCGLCGNDSDTAIRAIAAKAKGLACPLCDSALAQDQPANGDVHRLHEVDREIAKAKKAIQEDLKTLERLRKQEAATRKQWEGTKNALDAFDAANSAVLNMLRSQLGHTSSDAELSIYREQLAVMERDKQTAYDRREELKIQRANLQKELAQQYQLAETSFVPRFEELAKRFLGMPLTVQLDATAGRDLKLVVAVRGTTRRQQQELSESQRFFLDIALRMALTQHMSDPSSKGGMYIDTPEGSLDIAYEKRAGEMLAMFASPGHRIIMTANLNSSQLLLALAHQCGRKGMRLCRMTDWAELSAVQRDEEALFDAAYNVIEAAMQP